MDYLFILFQKWRCSMPLLDRWFSKQAKGQLPKANPLRRLPGPEFDLHQRPTIQRSPGRSFNHLQPLGRQPGPPGSKLSFAWPNHGWLPKRGTFEHGKITRGMGWKNNGIVHWCTLSCLITRQIPRLSTSGVDWNPPQRVKPRQSWNREMVQVHALNGKIRAWDWCPNGNHITRNYWWYFITNLWRWFRKKSPKITGHQSLFPCLFIFAAERTGLHFSQPFPSSSA